MTPKTGLMLYTLRGECARDFEGTLAAVAEIGYEGVELFELHGHEPEAVRGWLDRYGLAAVGRHAGLAELESGMAALAEETRVLGFDRVALSWIDPPSSADEARASAARIATLADDARRHGLRLGFHNHWGDVSVLDLLPEEVWLELDLGWIWVAGVDPVAQLEAMRGRCPLVHVKDFRSREGRDCPVGDGAVGYERVLPATVAAGVEWLLVEQDEVEGPPLAAVERSFAAVGEMLEVRA